MFGRAARMALAAAGLDPAVEHTVTDTALALGLAADGFGWTVATGTMLAFHHTDAGSVELPGGKRRDVVALTRHAALERPSVARVIEALADAGGRRK
jgi:DNA-binding transcriptional LysR family regulator